MAQGQWHPDPSRRHQLRWWDGRAWTHHVADNGAVGADPLVADPGRVAEEWPTRAQRADDRTFASTSGRDRSLRRLALHIGLVAVTLGAWLFALPAVWLWRRGQRAAAAVAGGVGVILLGAIITSAGGSDTTTTTAAQPAAQPTSAIAPLASVPASAKTTAPSEVSTSTAAKADDCGGQEDHHLHVSSGEVLDGQEDHDDRGRQEDHERDREEDHGGD